MSCKILTHLTLHETAPFLIIKGTEVKEGQARFFDFSSLLESL